MANINTNEIKCGFAMSGTYGHECGAPAVKVFVKKAELTSNGIFYTGRCEECSKIRGGENAGILRVEPVNGQVNQWKGVR